MLTKFNNLKNLQNIIKLLRNLDLIFFLNLKLLISIITNILALKLENYENIYSRSNYFLLYKLFFKTNALKQLFFRNNI